MVIHRVYDICQLKNIIFDSDFKLNYLQQKTKTKL